MQIIVYKTHINIHTRPRLAIATMFLLRVTKLTLMNSMTQCWLLVTESIANLDYNKQNKVPVAYENRIEK